MTDNTARKPHLLTLSDRSLLTVSGVEDVSGFDENTITVRISDCSLVVKGSSLHISRLSLESGEVVIDGTVSSLQYLNSSARDLRSRLFR